LPYRAVVLEASMTSKETRGCVLSFMGASLLILLGILLLFGGAVLFGPPHLTREDRVQVVSKARSLPSSVDISKIDTLISAHSQWEKRDDVSPDKSEEFFDLVYRKDINGDSVLDEIRHGYDFRISGSEPFRIRDPSVQPSYGTSVGFDDVDGDGFTDAWCCDPADGVVRVLYGDANGGFSVAQSIVGFGYFEGAFNDVDGDGDLDIVLREIDPGMNGKNKPTGEYSWIELESIYRR